LDCSVREKVALIELGHPQISQGRQAELLGISRSSVYYRPTINERDVLLKRLIDEIYTEAPLLRVAQDQGSITAPGAAGWA
jgi:putative transposase